MFINKYCNFNGLYREENFIIKAEKLVCITSPDCLLLYF